MSRSASSESSLGMRNMQSSIWAWSLLLMQPPEYHGVVTMPIRRYCERMSSDDRDSRSRGHPGVSLEPLYTMLQSERT